jgi:hypothetical protein
MTANQRAAVFHFIVGLGILMSGEMAAILVGRSLGFATRPGQLWFAIISAATILAVAGWMAEVASVPRWSVYASALALGAVLIARVAALADPVAGAFYVKSMGIMPGLPFLVMGYSPRQTDHAGAYVRDRRAGWQLFGIVLLVSIVMLAPALLTRR